jgi:hypothetical protein
MIGTRNAIDPLSCEPYERLGKAKRDLIDSVYVDAGGRLSESRKLAVHYYAVNLAVASAH